MHLSLQIQSRLTLAFLAFLLLSNLCFSHVPGEDAPSGNLTIQFDAMWGQDTLKIDKQWQRDKGGRLYSFSEVKFFFSGLTLTRRRDSSLVTMPFLHFRNLKDKQSRSARINNIPHGRYISFQSYLGLNTEYNRKDSLENLSGLVNIDTIPEAVGGGFAYLILEGQYKTEKSKAKPFKLIMGNNRQDGLAANHAIPIMIPFQMHANGEFRIMQLLVDIQKLLTGIDLATLKEDGVGNVIIQTQLVGNADKAVKLGKFDLQTTEKK